jgi:hypothetical protein
MIPRMQQRNPYDALGEARKERIEEYVKDAKDVGTILSSFQEVTADLSACIINPSVIGPPRNYLNYLPSGARAPEIIEKYSQFFEGLVKLIPDNRMILTHRAKSLLKRLFVECMLSLQGDQSPASKRLCNSLQQTHLTINRKEPYEPSHHSFQFFEDFSAAGRRDLVDSCNFLEKREIAAVFELSNKYPNKTALATRDSRQRGLAEKMIRHFRTPADIVIYDFSVQQYRKFVF